MMWKCHLNIKNYRGKGAPNHRQRWHSRTLAWQIKAELEGILPLAYWETTGRLNKRDLIDVFAWRRLQERATCRWNDSMDLGFASCLVVNALLNTAILAHS